MTGLVTVESCRGCHGSGGGLFRVLRFQDGLERGYELGHGVAGRRPYDFEVDVEVGVDEPITRAYQPLPWYLRVGRARLGADAARGFPEDL